MHESDEKQAELFPNSASTADRDSGIEQELQYAETGLKINNRWVKGSLRELYALKPTFTSIEVEKLNAWRNASHLLEKETNELIFSH
jgi:hypothetical protein